MKGFKAFESDWTCMGKQYAIGETFEEYGELIPCVNGIHFCAKLIDVFRFYPFIPETKIAEVEAFGDVKTYDDVKYCTNKIRIIKEIQWDEVLKLCNTGNRNTGNRNTGDCNTGNRNTGNCNTGDWNTGNRNTGDWNTGNCNTGNRNTGNWNTGDWNTGNRNTGNCNTGDWNTGNRNTGDWNTSDNNNGCFMTVEPKIMMFNQQSSWTSYDWLNSHARGYLQEIPCACVKWIYSCDMSDEEKVAHPEHETTDGYLKILDEKESAQHWWDTAPQYKKNAILALPNFDKEIFYQCTGIRIKE